MDRTEPAAGTQALSRALAVLDAVAQGCVDQGAIGRRVGTTRSTTSRLVAYLQREGYLRQADGRGYVLGSRLIELGAVALAQMPLTALARPLIEQLAAQSGDTVHLSVRDGDQIMYVDKISGEKGFEMRSGVGRRKPMAITGTGKAQMLDEPESEWARLYALARTQATAEPPLPPGFLGWDAWLASMRGYRDCGYAFELEENEAAICCVAAPIRDARARIVAGLSVASTTPYMSRERMDSLAPVVVACAAEISRGLGFSGSGAPAA